MSEYSDSQSITARRSQPSKHSSSSYKKASDAPLRKRTDEANIWHPSANSYSDEEASPLKEQRLIYLIGGAVILILIIAIWWMWSNMGEEQEVPRDINKGEELGLMDDLWAVNKDMKKCESDQIYLEQRCIALNAHKYTILTSILKSQINGGLESADISTLRPLLSKVLDGKVSESPRFGDLFGMNQPHRRSGLQGLCFSDIMDEKSFSFTIPQKNYSVLYLEISGSEYHTMKISGGEINNEGGVESAELKYSILLHSHRIQSMGKGVHFHVQNEGEITQSYLVDLYTLPIFQVLDFTFHFTMESSYTSIREKNICIKYVVLFK